MKQSHKMVRRSHRMELRSHRRIPNKRRKIASRNSAFPAIYSIPNELLAEILKKFPAKCLLRFMLVSKSWYELIKSPDFISLHFNWHNNNGKPRHLLYRNFDDFYVYKDDDSFERCLVFTYPGMFRDVGCSDGIVCFSVYGDGKYFVLWNSSARKSLDIKVPHGAVGDGVKTISWFGFDVVSDDYKLVWVAYSTRESWDIRPLVVYVYSLNERTWRCVNSSFVLDDVYLIRFKGLYLKGVIHWVVEGGYDRRLDLMPVSILTFNLADETFSEFDLPSEMVKADPNYDNYRGSLYPEDRVDLLIVQRNDKDCLAAVHKETGHLNFWVMEEEGIVASWSKVVSWYGSIEKFVNVRMNGEIVIQISKGVLSWDQVLCSLKHVACDKMDYVGTYAESLLLV